jgi:uncharacterized membrane protein
MRNHLPSVNLYLATAVMCLVLAACKPAQEPAAPASDAPAVTAGTEAAADAPPAIPSADAHSVDGDIVASTNEPFWNASVSGPVLTLSGIDGQRSLAVSTSETAGDARTLVATDAGGKVELKVTAKECRDTMSGAMFPFTAELAIDGGTPLNGCARPASMPPPGQGM